MSISARHPRPFRFGVLAESVRSREALLDTAHRAEDQGFTTFLIRDHFIAELFGHQLAPLTTLATVAVVYGSLCKMQGPKKRGRIPTSTQRQPDKGGIHPWPVCDH